jgi:hypothetical protein
MKNEKYKTELETLGHFGLLTNFFGSPNWFWPLQKLIMFRRQKSIHFIPIKIPAKSSMYKRTQKIDSATHVRVIKTNCHSILFLMYGCNTPSVQKNKQLYAPASRYQTI